MKLFLKHACTQVCIFRSIKVSLLVGTILVLINQYSAIFEGPFTKKNVIQIILTYMVPFCVATFSSAMQSRHIDLAQDKSANSGSCS
ncbi:MAG: nitrate/nitrite transporter NrtS [Candidatus Tantalella remota]|nr:nitrate/nitrite transporter NrtS [Candidatus Tantalella remota]